MEALAVATSVITLIDAIAKSYKTIEKIQGLPKAFDEVQKDLPLVRKILQDLQRRLQSPARLGEDDEALKVVLETVRDCDKKATILRDIFAEFEEKCREDRTAAKTWTRARAWYREALRGTKARRVEGLMKDILGHVETLAMNEVFSLHDELGNITKALNELSVTASSTAQVPESIMERKSRRVHHYIPIRRNTRFVGRTEIVDRLRDMLLQKEYDSVALRGLGGVGKTQTALNVAYWAKDNLPDHSVFWVSALSNESFDQSYGEIAQQLGLSASGRQDTKKAVQRYLSSDEAGRWLLVVDNADDGDMFMGTEGIQSFLPQRDECLTLFTTRSPDVASEVTDENVVEIPTMSEYEAKGLLHKLLNQPEPFDNNEIVEDLLRELNYLPLAIQHAAAYLNRNRVSVTSYLSLMKRSEKDLVSLLSRSFSNNNGYGGSQVSVATTWLVSFNQIRKSDPPAAEMLTFLSQIEPKAIPRSMLRDQDTEEQSVHAIGTLLGYSFITVRDDNKMFDMHSLVHLAAGAWIRQQGDIAQAVNGAVVQLHNVFMSLSDYGVRECLPHTLRLLRAVEEVGLDTEEACYLGSSVGDLLLHDGSYQEGSRVLERVVKSRQRTLDEEHPSRLQALLDLAKIYNFMNTEKGNRAIKILEHVVEVRARKYSENHEMVLQPQMLLASQYSTLGQSMEALAVAEHVVKMRSSTLKVDDPGLLSAQKLLARINLDLREVDTATGLLEHIVAVQATMENLDPQELIRVQASLADAYASGKRTKEAVELLEHVLNVYQTTVNVYEWDPYLLNTKYKLGRVYRLEGRYNDAVDILKSVMRVYEKMSQATDDYRHLLTQYELAVAYVYLKQRAEGIGLLEQIVATQKRSTSEGDGRLLSFQTNLAWAYLDDSSKSSREKGMKLIEYVVEARERMSGKENLRTVQSQQLLAWARTLQ